MVQLGPPVSLPGCLQLAFISFPPPSLFLALQSSPSSSSRGISLNESYRSPNALQKKKKKFKIARQLTHVRLPARWLVCAAPRAMQGTTSPSPRLGRSRCFTLLLLLACSTSSYRMVAVAANCNESNVFNNIPIEVAPKIGGYSQNQCGDVTTWTSIPEHVTSITLRVKCRQGGCGAVLTTVTVALYEEDKTTPLFGRYFIFHFIM